jgi:formate C-acetyltransferase
VQALLQKERENGGVLGVEEKIISQIDAFPPGYIDQKLELIKGLQTSAPLKRALKPFGGIRTVEKALMERGLTLSPEIKKIFTKYRKTHNEGVYDVYTRQMRILRKTGILTGLPDNYARGRIIGDYRRVALFGVEAILQSKQADLLNLENDLDEETIRLREEISDQIKALEALKVMAAAYGDDIQLPAKNAYEAIAWTYYAYLAAIKEQDGAAMSMGSVSGFFDIYLERDLKNGVLDEAGAQELIDDFVIKLRLVRHLRMDEYEQLFAGDPTWVTLVLGGCWEDGTVKVTKTDFRFLQTLYNLGPAPEPNLTILWHENLPENFKRFAAAVSLDTCAIQYENDNLMQKFAGDDYGVSCCVSCLAQGRQMQYFGARCNLAKALLLAINAGRDEITGILVVKDIPPLEGDYLDYQQVTKNFAKTMKFLAHEYVQTMNVIHYMHDKYYYERALMALLDTKVERLMAFGLAGFSVVADSLSAIKHARVKVMRDRQRLSQKFIIEGEFPTYGNDDDRVDVIAQNLVKQFYQLLTNEKIYRQAKPTLSVLTITSNVVYGKKTGATPDGRLLGEPFAPGANPMHGRDRFGALASLNSVAKLNYHYAQDGISNTFSITPSSLGKTREERVNNLVQLLTGYFNKGGHHLNVNILDRDLLQDAMKHPEKYPQLTIRVSGYAVNFHRLSLAQQEEVIGRTWH